MPRVREAVDEDDEVAGVGRGPGRVDDGRGGGVGDVVEPEPVLEGQEPVVEVW